MCHLSEINFDRIGRTVATIKQYEYQFFKQMREHQPSRSFMNSLTAISGEIKHKAVRVFGSYTVTAFKRSSEVSSKEVRDGYQ
jgi:hypothetical protein